jgi:hypothetical protein
MRLNGIFEMSLTIVLAADADHEDQSDAQPPGLDRFDRSLHIISTCPVYEEKDATDRGHSPGRHRGDVHIAGRAFRQKSASLLFRASGALMKA